MNTKLDELFGSELAGKLIEALGLGDKGEAEAVLRQVKSLETELVMDALHSAPDGTTVAKIFHRALIDALAQHVTEKNRLEDELDKLEDRIDALAGELSEAHEDARYVVNERDSLRYEVTNLRYQVEDIAPYRALVGRLAAYVTATPGTLDAFDSELARKVDCYLTGDLVGANPELVGKRVMLNPKLEAIKVVRQALLCGLKEAKDLVEARMAMHAADQAVTQAEKDTMFEKLNRTGPLKWCVKCGRFMPIDADRKILSHPNLFTGVECEGTEVIEKINDPELEGTGIEHWIVGLDQD